MKTAGIRIWGVYHGFAVTNTNYTYEDKDISNSYTTGDKELAARAEATGRVQIQVDPDYPRETVVSAHDDLDACILSQSDDAVGG